MLKILLIEDDDSLANMYALKLERGGYEVMVAKEGETGIKIAIEQKPALILLDIIMPKVDGFSVLEQLKQNGATKNIPVCILTNLGQEEDVKKGKALGAVNYFIKADTTPRQIVDQIKEILGNKKYE